MRLRIIISTASQDTRCVSRCGYAPPQCAYHPMCCTAGDVIARRLTTALACRRMCVVTPPPGLEITGELGARMCALTARELVARNGSLAPERRPQTRVCFGSSHYRADPREFQREGRTLSHDVTGSHRRKRDRKSSALVGNLEKDVFVGSPERWTSWLNSQSLDVTTRQK